LFLTQEDLVRLTGKRRPSAQVAWLQRAGWKHKVNGLKEPVVALAEFNRHMVGGRAKRVEPKYEAIDGAQA
jgi:hypothetical protein